MTPEQLKSVLPGIRVLVFDTRLYKDDIKTPLTMTMQPATVLTRYGFRSQFNNEWIYPDVVDVIFDRDQHVSKGHFTNYLEILK